MWEPIEKTFIHFTLLQYQVPCGRKCYASYQDFNTGMPATFRKIDEAEPTFWKMCDVPWFKITMNYSNFIKVSDQAIDTLSAPKILSMGEQSP